MSARSYLDRSQESAEAETGHVDSPVQQCHAWVGIEARYDDHWQTPITGRPVKITVEGSTVANGPLNKSLKDFGLEDGQPHRSIRAFLSQHRVDGVKEGDAKVELVPTPEDDPDTIEEEILEKLREFETSMTSRMSDWTSVWEEEGWASVPEAYLRGAGTGMKSWWEGEVEFWSSLPDIAGAVWDAIKRGFSVVIDGLASFFESPGEVLEEAQEQLVAIWGKIGELARAFAEGSANAIQHALEALKDLPGLPSDLVEILTGLVENSADWAQQMIEVARETEVFQRFTSTVMRVLLLLTPNFWAEVNGTIGGFVLPEIIITVLLILIGALLTAATEGGSAAPVATVLGLRIAAFVRKVKAAVRVTRNTRRVLQYFFTKIDEICELIGRLSRALKSRIDEAAEGATNLYNRVVRRRVRPKRQPYHRHDLSDEWYDPETGNLRWPPQDGFDGAPTTTTLDRGTRIDRYSARTGVDDAGSFLSPEGTSWGERALPYERSTQQHAIYEVVDDLEVQSGPAAAWFDQPGGGTQYYLGDDVSVGDLVEAGILRQVQ